MSGPRRPLAVLLLLLALPARADEPPAVPPPVELPPLLTLSEALRLFHERGLDLLIADAGVMAAGGDVIAAGQVQNPNISAAAGPAFNYSAGQPGCAGCQDFALQWSVSDNGALFDVIVGKRALRVKGARAALSAARMNRVDAERNLVSSLKQQYMTVVLARAALDFSLQVQKTMVDTLALTRKRFESGAIDSGALARVEVQKLEADQTVDGASLSHRQAQVALAFLLGVRRAVPDFQVEKTLLVYQVPPELSQASEEQLLASAFEHRPDLASLTFSRQQSEAQLALLRRQVFPDVSLYVNYSQLGVGQNVGQPMNAVVGLQLNLPVFYQLQGEIQHGRAALAAGSLLVEKGRAQVVSDVHSAWASFRSSKEIVERMETSLLSQARTARDIVQLQFQKGAATLMDFLDAQRTFIAINQEYFQDLDGYWTAVFQLEQSVGGRVLP